MKKENGYTAIEVIISVFILLVVCLAILAPIQKFTVNSLSATESRAYEGLQRFIDKNDISNIKRKTCAGDSDDDGYGSCSVTLTDGEKIYLLCPTDFIQNKLIGAESCKEVEGVYRIK